MKLPCSVFCLCVSLVLTSTPARSQVVISEFMAVNSGTFVDEDADSSDWIEVHNQGFSAIDLNGWCLTDDRGDLTKWRFPSIVLDGGLFLVVFASGKDRSHPLSELHTNFRLGASGEYLALVEPDGLTVAHEYAPAFPRQRADISYGIGQDLVVDALVAAGSNARILIPRDDTAGTSWRGGAEPFADAAWLHGKTGVGFQLSQPGFSVRTILANTGVGSIGAAEDVVRNGSLQAKVIQDHAPIIDLYNTGGTGHYNGNAPFPGTVVGEDVNDFVVEVVAAIDIPIPGAWTFGVNSDDGFSLDISGPGGNFHIEHPTPRGPGDTLGVFNVASAGSHDMRLLFYERGGGAGLELYATRGSFSSWSSRFRRVGDTASGGLAAESDSGAVGGYRNLIATDVLDDMMNVASSAYVRIPFEVDDPGAYESLTLRMKYDDGFVAYLNGIELARQNAPAPIRFDSSATADRPPAQARTFQNIDVTDHLGILRPGPNILAIHGLNETLDSGDFLVVAELAEITVESMVQGSFDVPTPGAANSTTLLNFVADTAFEPNRGFYSQPIGVEITTETEGANIYYTTDGSVPSPASGRLYTAPIAIARTTTLRAAAYKADLLPTNVDTHTYIFLDDVITQTGAGFPSTWGSVTADYAMDPAVVNDPRYAPDLRRDLLSIPSLSIVMEVDDLFGASRGIYSNSGGSGISWERPGSIELILPVGVEISGGGDGFQVDCGVRMHGGVGRSSRVPKHSFRFLFKGRYGPTKLNYPLFADAPTLRHGRATEKFDTLILRAGFNNSWVFNNSGQMRQAQYLRDQFIRDSLLAMGQPNPHGSFVHVYVNGLYWGLYNLVERPNAPFASEYFGGSKNDWDILNSGEVIDGSKDAWNQMYAVANQGLSSAAGYAAIQEYLDVPNLIDYMIANFYGGNSDWDGHNWYSGRYRAPGAGYKFFSWDAERTLESVNGGNKTGQNSNGNPSGIYSRLRANEAFRLRFADRAHRHLFNGGALDPEVARERYRRRAEEIHGGIVGESARWGDAHREPPFTRDAEWMTERNRLLNSYFPQRTGVFLSQLRAADLYPDVDAPRFSQHGGNIPDGLELLMTAGAGTVYYTLNGEDPRRPDGAISPTARVAGTASQTTLVSETSGKRVIVPKNGALGLDWTTPGFDDTSWRQGSGGVGYEQGSGYAEFIQIDVGPEMVNITASVYVRTEFTIDDPAKFAFLTLRMKYDDGFIAYLNGTRVAERNAPLDPQWNSTAAGNHSDSAAVVFENVDLAGAVGALRAGKNVLAIHGLNTSTTSSDMLLVPQLNAGETSGAGVSLDQTTWVRSRTFLDGEWSAMNEATFVRFPLRVTEIMYHPAPSEPPGEFGDEDFEFVELRNVSADVLDLSGVRLLGDVEFDFDTGATRTLGPGEYTVVAEDLLAFDLRYGLAGRNVTGQYRGNLSNRGGTLRLLGPRDETIQEFTYEDGWHLNTDGIGHSLVIVDELAAVDAWSRREGWKESDLSFGSPGEAEDASGGRQRPGDANQDASLDIGDAVSMLLIIFGAPTRSPPCDDAVDSEANVALLDFNADRLVDQSDAVYLLVYLYRSGPPHALGQRCVRIEGCADACLR